MTRFPTRRRAPAPLVLGLMAGLVPALAPAEQASKLPQTSGARELLYHLDWGPIPLAEIRVNHQRGPQSDALAIKAETVGLVSIFSGVDIERVTERAAGGGLRYIAKGGERGGNARSVVSWAGDGTAPVVEISVREDAGPLTPIPEDELLDTMGPGAAILTLLDKVGQDGTCAGTFRLYDGLRRMDLIVEDEGADAIEADRDWTYAGPARRCRLHFRRIGGFPADETRETRESDYDRLLWIASLQETPTPVRLQVDWPLGSAVGRIDLR